MKQVTTTTITETSEVMINNEGSSSTKYQLTIDTATNIIQKSESQSSVIFIPHASLSSSLSYDNSKEDENDTHSTVSSSNISEIIGPIPSRSGSDMRSSKSQKFTSEKDPLKTSSINGTKTSVFPLDTIELQSMVDLGGDSMILNEEYHLATASYLSAGSSHSRPISRVRPISRALTPSSSSPLGPRYVVPLSTTNNNQTTTIPFKTHTLSVNADGLPYDDEVLSAYTSGLVLDSLPDVVTKDDTSETSMDIIQRNDFLKLKNTNSKKKLTATIKYVSKSSVSNIATKIPTTNTSSHTQKGINTGMIYMKDPTTVVPARLNETGTKFRVRNFVGEISQPPAPILLPTVSQRKKFVVENPDKHHDDVFVPTASVARKMKIDKMHENRVMTEAEGMTEVNTFSVKESNTLSMKGIDMVGTNEIEMIDIDATDLLPLQSSIEQDYSATVVLDIVTDETVAKTNDKIIVTDWNVSDERQTGQIGNNITDSKLDSKTNRNLSGYLIREEATSATSIISNSVEDLIIPVTKVEWSQFVNYSSNNGVIRIRKRSPKKTSNHVEVYQVPSASADIVESKDKNSLNEMVIVQGKC